MRAVEVGSWGGEVWMSEVAETDGFVEKKKFFVEKMGFFVDQRMGFVLTIVVVECRVVVFVVECCCWCFGAWKID